VLDAGGAEVQARTQPDGLLAGGIAADAEGLDPDVDGFRARDLLVDAEDRGRVRGVDVVVLARRDTLLDRLRGVDHEIEITQFDLREVERVHPGVGVDGQGRAVAEGEVQRIVKRDLTITFRPALCDVGIEIPREPRHYRRGQSYKLIESEFLWHLRILLGLPFGKTTPKAYRGWLLTGILSRLSFKSHKLLLKKSQEPILMNYVNHSIFWTKCQISSCYMTKNSPAKRDCLYDTFPSPRP